MEITVKSVKSALLQFLFIIATTAYMMSDSLSEPTGAELLSGNAPGNEYEEIEAVEIPGVSIDDTWTWTGYGYIKLTWETGTVCYIEPGCYEFDFSMRFRQVGESDYGRPIYLTSSWYDTYVWLPGAQRGGIVIFLYTSVLADFKGENFDLPYYFEQRPGWH